MKQLIFTIVIVLALALALAGSGVKTRAAGAVPALTGGTAMFDEREEIRKSYQLSPGCARALRSMVSSALTTSSRASRSSRSSLIQPSI